MGLVRLNQGQLKILRKVGCKSGALVIGRHPPSSFVNFLQNSLALFTGVDKYLPR
jgi:hypothetical protein